MEKLLRSGTLGYDHRDDPETRAEAAQRLAADPALGDAGLHVAAMLGRSQTVARLLAATPDLATTPAGPRDWPPLLYLTYGRVDGRREGESYLQAAEALLDAGADPNSHWLWDGTYRFSALTGCFGEGEGGPRAQPEHVEMLPLAKLLLARGANPNDGQALYNRMFTPGCTCLELLIQGGLQPEDRINWPVDDPDARTTMSYQLFHAAHNGDIDRIELLLAAGVNVHETAEDGATVARAALISGQRAALARLTAAGVEPGDIDDLDRLTSFLRAGDLNEAKALIAGDAELFAAAEARHGDFLNDAISREDLDGIELILSLGVDINRNRHTPAAHHAARNGKLDALKLVLARGADPNLKDQRFNATALDWARHGGIDHTAEFLESLDGS